MKSSIAYFPHGVPRTITEFGNQKIGAVKFGNVARLLEKQRKIIFKTTQSIKYLTEPILQAWNLTSNLYQLWDRILMLPGTTGRQVHLAEINYLLLCHMTLWQDLIQAFRKLGKERKKRGDGDDATAEDGFHALRTSCFWPINDQFIKILNQESLLEEWWKYVYKVENSIMEIIKWLGKIIVKTEEESSSSTPLSTTPPVFTHTMVASLLIGLVRWLGSRNKKGEAIMLSAGGGGGGGGGFTDDDRRSELFFEKREQLYADMCSILEEKVPRPEKFQRIQRRA